jgi:hypothetical protein
MQRGVDGTWIDGPLQQQSSPSPVRILRAAVRCGCRGGPRDLEHLWHSEVARM